jgi:hypothetical protein
MWLDCDPALPIERNDSLPNRNATDTEFGGNVILPNAISGPHGAIEHHPTYVGCNLITATSSVHYVHSS